MPASPVPAPAKLCAIPVARCAGKLVWAKVGINPWWPAKLLDPARDLSYPADADPPRPTSIPIRFFGTFEFQWIGSKRQLADWEEVCARVCVCVHVCGGLLLGSVLGYFLGCCRAVLGLG